ncbi:methyl-CpG-binding domain protein 3-like [Tubulanus polymorphus]|uniref:methyl-CpG-binding domain protein 3-like n=1 Tax=Tubulanus polymorphus TaxID=672921 RepID=UPI003DA52EF3
MSVVERRFSVCAGLPSGWKREEIIRKSGLSAGKTDVYYYSPDGRKIRTKPMMARVLGDSFDLASFDFRSGKINQNPLRKRMRHDAALALPIRQTASIFKQPVTVKRTRSHSKTKTDLKHGVQDQPKQLFWEKRLQGLTSCDKDEEKFKPFNLPRNIRGIGPALTDENLLQSIAACLHNNSTPVLGQEASKVQLQKNPGVHINADQPMIQSVMINDDDVRRQEQKVIDARRRLIQALRAGNLASST